MEVVAMETTVDEVAQLKTAYQKNCRVMKTVGDFTYVISLQLPEQNVQLKFQLTASYPEVAPGIIVLSPDLSADCVDQLNAFLIEKSNDSIGKAMIQDLVKEGISWLRTNSVPKSPNSEKKTTKNSQTPKKSKHEKKNQKNTENHCEKKPSMRTAIDVISRIQWDESLPTEEFLVGYLDRFIGIQEKPFLAFSWEDIASVDYHTLAIPKHRICYFKYKTIKIWDKAQRLDLVFGSTGDTRCLADVMANYKNEENCPEGGAHFETSQSDPDNVLSCECLASSLLDVDLNVCDDFPNSETRANFFIALRINAEAVHEQVAEMQNSVLQEEPAYRDCRIQPDLLHITLCALCLKTPDHISSAVQILKDAKPELSKLVAFACPLDIAGVKHFANRALYADIDAPPQFLQITDFLKSKFQAEGFLHLDHHKTFQPHMSLFKLSRAVMRENEVDAINKKICERYSGYRFGKQDLDNLYLCSMDKVRQEDGFYLCPASLQI